MTDTKDRLDLEKCETEIIHYLKLLHAPKKPFLMLKKIVQECERLSDAHNELVCVSLDQEAREASLTSELEAVKDELAFIDSNYVIEEDKKVTCKRCLKIMGRK